MKRKFADGGETTERLAPEKPEAAPDMQVSFKDAFRAARGHGLKTFEWRGTKYTTELEKPKTYPEPVQTRNVQPKNSSAYPERVATRSATPPAARTATLPKVTVTGKRPSTVSGAFPQNQDDAKRPSIYDSPEKWKAYREGKPAPAETPRRKFDMDTSAQVDYLQSMKKGGGVKKYARGGGIEAKGKTRGKIC